MRHKHFSQLVAGICCIMLAAGGAVFAESDPFLSYRSISFDAEERVVIELDNTTLPPSVEFEIYCSDESAMTTPFFSSDVYWHLIDKGTYPSSSPAFVDAGSKIRTKPSDQSVSFRFYAVGNAAIDSDNDGLTDAYEHLVTRTSPLLVDTDGNSIPDAMEDFDNDNLINSDEYNRLTDPWIQDTDNDGVSDFAETNSGVYQNEFSRGSNPLDPDTDEDGLTDNLESISVLADGFETGDYSVLDWSHQGDLNWLVAMGTAKDGSFAARVSEELNDDQAAVLILTQELTAESIFSFDYKVSSESVHDVFLLFINDVLMETWSGEVDWQTYTTVLSPGVYDIKFVFQKNEENSSGNDTVWIDNVRFASGTDPNIADMDGDTLNDGEEQQYGTSPFKSDTDSDGLSDTDEIFLHGTDPRLMDTDFDGLDDLTELNLGTDPVVGDTDNDSIPDGWENSWGLNPNVADSMLDSDTDDLTNYEEYKLNSDPLFAGDPFIVYVDNEGSGGSGTQFDPYGSIQEAIDSTPYTDGFTEYPVVFKLADGIYDLALDDFMYNNGLNSLTIDNNFLYNTYFDNYRLAIIGSSPENVIIKGIRGFAGISMFYADDFPYAPIVLKNLTITNSLEALHIEGSSPAVVNCIIRDNLGDFGSAVFIRDSLAPEIINCLITRNRAIAGAGIYISDTAGYTSSPVITHSTFADNIAEQGIAIFVVNSSISSPDPLIFNSIIWETSGDDIYGVSASMIRYCDIEDGDYNGQNNNISLNPLFATPHLLNYRITANSPCRNAGHLFGFFTPDIDSELRPANSGTDMGYDEFVDVNANNLPDAWEALYGGSYTATGDNDLDGVNNLTESRYRSDPTFGDTDGDTLTDFEEIITYGTNPLADADNDGDRLYDVDEILTHGTNPHSKDSDGDRITDDWEVAYGLNPLLDDAGLDPDTDDLTNYEEFFMYTDPFNATDPYPYYVVDTVFDPFTESTTIQGAMTLINDDRGFYGYFVGKIVVLVDGDYSENVQMEPDVVIIGNPSDREAVRLLGSGFSNLITMDADAFAVFKSLTFDSGARGLFIRDSDALITNCLIKNNEFATALDGGGLYIYNAGVEIIGSTITNNRSLGYGGGAYAERATVTLRNSIFSTNKAHLSGGGLYMKDSSLSIYENSSLSGNQTVWITGGAAVSGEGGGIYISNISPVEGKLEIKNSSVQNNLGFSAGGAIYAIQTEVALENATILNNDVTDVRENDNDGYGGALYLDKTISRLKDSTFTGNETFISGGAVFGQYYYIHLDGCVFQTNICEQNGGAGLFVDVNLDIVETTFKGNKTSVDKGGALNFDVGTATITDSLFETNTASGEGGALYSLGTHLTVSQSVFSGNTAISTEAAGGAIASESNVLIDITDSEFKKNTAKRFGGALYFKECNPLVANSVFTENGTTFRGGTIYLEDADLTLTNSVLKKNTASSAGAGITLFSTKDSVSGNPINPSHANITNTLFKGNVSSAVAGAIQFEEYSTANVQFCVIVDNVSYSNVGGGIYIQFPHPTTHPVNLLNTILWNNDDDLFGFDQTTVSFCNISDGDFEGIKGNLSEEPNFTNPSIDDYHLRNDSPLLKMGTAYYSTGVDVDGETRPSTSNFSLETAPRPIPQAADIGYDEFVDSDGDNLPDYWENSYVGSFDNDGDNDNDGLLNIDEYLNNTSPVDNDSDNDGLTDYDELFVYFTDPHIDADKDLDGISDKDEILIHSTNP
ncbi:hypothetical protein KDK77_07200, partial [bacterium]|nr:hypothetical protein [bacterium]